MKLALAVFGAAALVGVGYVVGKKIIEKRREEEFYGFDDLDECDEDDEGEFDGLCGECDGCKGRKAYKEKVKEAALFAIGAAKTGADKVTETVRGIKTDDMVEKGRKAVEVVKETAGNIKNDIKREAEELKTALNSELGGTVQSTPESDDAASVFGEAPDSVFRSKTEAEEVKEAFGDGETSK